MQPPSQLEPMLEVMGEVAQLARDGTPLDNPLPNRPATQGVMGIYSGCPQFFEASTLLCERRLAGPLLALARILFEHAIKLQDIAWASDGGDALGIRWMVEGYEFAEGIMTKDAVRLGVETDPEPMIEHLAIQRKHIEDYRRQHPSLGRAKFSSPEVAARNAGYPHAYIDYRLACQPVHASLLAALSRRATAGQTVKYNLGASDEKDVIGPGVMATQWFLIAWEAAARVLGWSIPDLTAIRSRIHRIVDPPQST